MFLKPTSSYLEDGGTIQIPHNVDTLHHEVELAVVIVKKARDVLESSAMDYVGGNALCITEFYLKHIFRFLYYILQVLKK